MEEVRSAKPSVNEASFTGQTQEQFSTSGSEYITPRQNEALGHYSFYSHNKEAVMKR